MYTVVVADDEEEIRKLLVRKICWEEVGFQVVGEAENGEEALELVEQLEPDLLLTDVKMPFVSGIELARQVREIRPMTNIAFLSGYDDFVIAQQAIQYNIISYMLKPVSAVELMEELRKIRVKIEDKYRAFAFAGDGGERMGKSEFLMGLLLDNSHTEITVETEEALVQNALECGVLKTKPVGTLRYLVLVTVITDAEGKNHTNKQTLHAVDEIMDKYMKHMSVYVSGKVISLLIATQKALEKYLPILVEDISQNVQKILQKNASLGVGRSVASLSRVHESYVEAMNALSYASRTSGSIHFIADEERQERFDQETVQKSVAELERLLRGQSEEALKAYVAHLFAEMKRSGMAQSVMHFIRLQVITTVFQVTYAVAGNDAVNRLQKDSPLHWITTGGDPNREVQQYTEFALLAQRLIAEKRKQSGEILCDRAVRIIQEQYMNSELSLIDVSNQIAVSPNYLSAMLKKETGSTFKELLTQKRMEVADALLAGSSMKIREVSEKCGYNDQHYFSYCYKKYRGESPNVRRRKQ
jgi:two-component system response regulator YesN